MLDGIDAGQAALRRADWTAAKAHFEQALREADAPEAHDGLGLALWWLNEIGAAHEARGRAYNGWKETQPGRAARVAAWLAREQVFLHANVPAMLGWFARAERLLGGGGGELDRAWYEVMRASVLSPPAELAAVAGQTLETARRLGDVNLEAFALAFHGLAQVAEGRVGAGMLSLDEAMTMTTGGEVNDFMTISEVFCVMLSACETAGDLVRSDHWCRAAQVFAQRHHCAFLSAYCRTAYGALMTALGRWGDAENSLLEAIAAFEQGHAGLRIHAVIRLADLRVSQDRLDEAAILLDGLEDQSAAVVPLARLHLRRGDVQPARALLEQMLTTDSDDTLHQLPALLTLVEVFAAQNEADAANSILDRLDALAQRAQSGIFTAQVALARGLVHLRAGDSAQARQCFEAALKELALYRESLPAGQARLRMALTLQDNDPVGAAAWAKAALATFERLGASRDAAEAAHVLRRLGASVASAPRLMTPLTEREAEIARLVAKGLTNREIADRLVISARTVEHHVSRVLDKLNLRSRTEAAAFLASGKLDERP